MKEDKEDKRRWDKTEKDGRWIYRRMEEAETWQIEDEIGYKRMHMGERG